MNKSLFPSTSFNLGVSARWAITLAAFAAYTAGSPAATIALNVPGDTIDTTSFNTGLNWAGGAAPIAGIDYFVGTGASLRTPITAGDFTFAGDSLLIGAGGTLNTKSPTIGATFTISNFTLDGGTLTNANNTVGTSRISGNSFTVNSTGGTINTPNGSVEIASTTSAINGTLNVINTNTSASANTDLPVIFSGTGSFGTAGKLTLTKTGNGIASRALFASTSLYTFDIGASGTTYMSAIGTSQRTKSFTLNGTFAFTLGAEDLLPGNYWTIIDSTNATKTYGGTFSIANFTNSAGTWTSNDGNYQFVQSSGVLSVVAVPESSHVALAIGGALGILIVFRHRRRHDFQSISR